MKDTLEVLQYMKQEGLVPGEVMYTSLMGVALSLAEKENKSVIRKDGLQVSYVLEYAENTTYIYCHVVFSLVIFRFKS
jgi:hypothetical protein